MAKVWVSWTSEPGGSVQGTAGQFGRMSGLQRACVILFHVREWDGHFSQAKVVWEPWGRRTAPVRRPLLCDEMSGMGPPEACWAPLA